MMDRLRRNNSKYKMLFIMLIITIIFSTTIPNINSLSASDIRRDLTIVYKRIEKAEAAGGNVSDLLIKLNDVARLMDLGNESDLMKANSIIRDVDSQVSLIESEGIISTNSQILYLSLSLILILFVIMLVWFKGSGLFWRIWLWYRRSWRFERV